MVNLSSVLNEFKFLGLSGTLGLQVTITTAKVLGSNLTGSFFQTVNFPFQKNMSAFYLYAYVLSAFLPPRIVFFFAISSLHCSCFQCFDYCCL